MAVTAIRITIGRDTLGECTTEEEAEQFADAVAAAVEADYPGASVDVTIADHSAPTSIEGIEWLEIDDTAEEIRLIQQRIWGEGEWWAVGNS